MVDENIINHKYKLIMQCSSCLTEIHDIKAHYKTEYHRYNIARKLVNL